MAAALHQAAADEGEVGNAVEQHQLAHGIANDYLGTGGGDLAGAAQSKAHPSLLYHLTGVREALRMAGNKDQQQVRESLQQFFMRLEDDLFFTVVGAGGNPDLAVWCPLPTQRHRPGRQLWRDGDIEFQAAGDRQLVALQPQREEAVTIFFILRGDKRNAAQQAAHKAAQFGIAFGGTFGQARVGDHQRDLTLMQRGHHIRPQLGFHNDNQLRLNGIQEAVHGAGQIVGQIDVMNIFAKRRHGAFGAGRRHGGDSDRQRRVAVAQGANQRNGG